MTPRFFDCSVEGCERPRARTEGGGCDLCERHFCRIHMSPDHHTCIWFVGPYGEPPYAFPASETARLLANFDEKAVCDLASSLNGGVLCDLEYPRTPAYHYHGFINYHIRIRFADGSRPWLMRVPRVTGFVVGIPVSLAEYIIQSEYATLKFLETTAVPAPRAFSFGIRGADHGVGVCFILVEELPGKPWRDQGDGTKVWEGVAEILAELEKHPFDKIGSLFVNPPDDTPRISAIASDRFGCLFPYGPFETSEAYYTAWAEQYLQFIADGQLYPTYSVEAYLVYRFLQDKASQLSDSENKFFLKPVDDWDRHIMVDEDLNVTGITDWQMARIVPREEAFAPSLVSCNLATIWKGTVSLSLEDVSVMTTLIGKGVKLGSQATTEKARRFFWGLGLEDTWEEAHQMAEGILKVFGVQQGWEEWKEMALKQYAGDERLKVLIEASTEPRVLIE